MGDDQQLARRVSQALNEQIVGIEPLGVAYGSNRLYAVQTAAGARYVVKLPKAVRESVSPFWQQMAAIFGINRVTQLTALNEVAGRLQQQTIIPVPQVIHIETAHALPDAAYAIVTQLDGAAHEPDEFPASAAIHYQLGQYVGYLHTQAYAGYGNLLLAQLQPKANFGATLVATMHQTVTTFWQDQPALHTQIDQVMAKATPDAIFSRAALIMIDISANQFVYQQDRISGVVDLDAYVIGPIEWELSILEMCITNPVAFGQGYACYSTLPSFAPFRAIYRLWSYLNEPGQGYNADDFSQLMQRAVYFA